MSNPRLSAVLCVHDEADQLAECLALLAFCDELVVVLDRCTDGSREIAAGFGARLIEGAFEIEGDRRNAAIAAATGDWLLEIDADERISPTLGEEIRRTVRSSTADWHRIPVDNYVGQRLIRYGWGASFGRGQVAALFRRSAKRWGDQRVHPKIALRGRVGATLETPLAHYVDTGISDMIRRLDRYTSARARDLRENGIDEGLGRNVKRMFSRFYKCYVGRKGYKEGGWGFLIALMAALYPVLSHLKATLEDG
ncbi:MAG: glycosyltransferase [Azospirillum sp.]|nr:glycosyltransferase [Azospirillum sp.]